MTPTANDALRAQIPHISSPNLLLLTRGIADLGTAQVVGILEKIKRFSDFNKDNDPWQEHDFGSFQHDGQKVFWKIDDYAGQDGYELILTVMLAEEY